MFLRLILEWHSWEKYQNRAGAKQKEREREKERVCVRVYMLKYSIKYETVSPDLAFLRSRLKIKESEYEGRW